MGFYSANTPEQKRVKKLTGDINIHDMFKNECNTRGIQIYNAYNIQKRLLHEVEQEELPLDNDVRAYQENYISITPVHRDLTKDELVEAMPGWGIQW